MKNLLKVFKKPPSNTPRRSLRENFFRSYGLKPIRERLDLDYFTILYCQSRYDNISPIYLLYKYLQAFIMVAYLCLNVTRLDFFERDNLKWNIYLNHWSTLVSFAEASCGVFVVNYFYHHCRTKAMRSEMNISDSVNDRLLFYMYLNASSITFSTTASFLFWAFIFDKDYLTVVKLLEHGSMPVFMVLKLMIERIPFEIPFVFHPMLILICYFVNVLITYYVVYHQQVPKQYIFKNFNTERPMYFLWFAIKACLLLAAIHVLLVAIFLSKRLLLRLLCRNRSPPSRSRMNIANRSVHSFTPASRGTNWMASKDDENMIQKPISDSTNNVVRRTFDIIGYLETLHRQDFIHPEWRHYSADHPSGFYLTYRVLHMLLFITIIIFSFIEFDKLRYSEYSVKYIILWIFYFGNFFLIVSCFQSLFGLVVIYKAYRRDSRTMKYYQKSDSYVTGFQKGYATIHSAATTLAIFAFVTSWQLVEDTGGGFMSLDYSYDSSHIINPLAMTLDFLVVGHAFKFKYLILSFGILFLNIVFNYWLYKSRITSRKGNRVVYEYLNWDDTVKAITHAIILLLQCIFIHVILWTIFLCKRYYGVVLNRRRVLGYQVNISRVRMTVTRPPGQSTDYYSGSRIFGGFSQDDISGSPEKKEDDQSGEKTSENSEDSEMGFTLIGSDASLSGETNKTKSPTESKNVDLADQSNITNDTGISDPNSIETTIKAILQEKIRSVSRTSDPNFEKYSMNASTAPTSQDPSQSNVNKLPKSHSSSKILSSIESIWSSATSILKHHKSKTSNPISEVQHGSNNQLKSEESAHTVSTRGFTSGGSGKSPPQESMSSIKPIPATELSNVSIKAESAKAVVGSTPQPEAPHVEDGQVSKSNKESSSNAGKQPVKTGNNAARSSTDDESTD